MIGCESETGRAKKARKEVMRERRVSDDIMHDINHTTDS